MGFWSTVLAALRFRASQLPVVTEPLQVHRLRLNLSLLLLRRDSITTHRVLNNVNLAHRVRTEAK